MHQIRLDSDKEEEIIDDNDLIDSYDMSIVSN